MGKVSNAPKRTSSQHYVPRLHLKHFTGPDRFIWTYSKSRGDARRSRIEETGAQANFYSPRDEQGKYFDGLDHLLQDIESKAAPTYRGLIKGVIPHGQERADFSVFLATSYTRSPGVIRAAAELRARLAALELRRAAAHPETFNAFIDQAERDGMPVVADRESARKFISEPARYTLSTSQKQGLSALGVADDIAPLLFRREWKIGIATSGFFITSDCPLFVAEPSDAGPSGAFTNPNALISFPLSSTRMLLLNFDREPDVLLPISPLGVRRLNELRAWGAEDLLFAKKEDTKVRELAAHYSRPGFRFQLGHPLAEGVEVNLTR